MSEKLASFLKALFSFIAVKFSSKSWSVLFAITDCDLSSDAFVGMTFWVVPEYLALYI